MKSHRPRNGYRHQRFALFLSLLALWSSAPAHAICQGKAVTAGFDFAAALFAGNTLQCGGTLLRGGWILTAAHCGKIERVVVGKKNLKTAKAADKIKVDQCLRHSGYDRSTGENDLALIRLVSLPAGIGGVALVEPGWKEGTAPLTILGYGPECTNSSLLMAASVLPENQGQCTQEYSHADVAVPSQIVCTGTGGGVGVDPGDSGGGVFAGPPENPRLAGVIKWGFAPNLPDFHVRLTGYLAWIQQVENGDSSQTKACSP